MNKVKYLDAELTSGDMPNGQDSYGLIIWLETTDKKTANKQSDEIIKYLNEKN